MILAWPYGQLTLQQCNAHPLFGIDVMSYRQNACEVTFNECLELSKWKYVYMSSLRHVDFGLSGSDSRLGNGSCAETIGGGRDTNFYRTSGFGQDCSGNIIHGRNHVEECDPGSLLLKTCISHEFRCEEKPQEVKLLHGVTMLLKCPPYGACSPLIDQEHLCFRTSERWGKGCCHLLIEVAFC